MSRCGWTADGVTAEARTDDDGRVRELGPARLDRGTYRVVFATGEWFAAQGRETFYPEVVVTFTVDDPDGHLHVPLLLSPVRLLDLPGELS